METVNQVVESGTIKQRNLVTVIVGLVGSGKTTIICRLFGIEPPKLYTSTGVAERSLRGLLHHIAKMDSWRLLSSEHILEFWAPLSLPGVPEADIVSLANTFADVEGLELTSSSGDMLPTTQPQTCPSTTPVTATATPLSSTIPQVSYTQIEKSSAVETLVHLVRFGDMPQEDTALELLHVVDTGGQQAFMEVMPCLMHNSHVTVLVLNLAQSLDDYPAMVFHEDGRGFKCPIPSALTTRQLILQLACTMQAKRSTLTKGLHSRIVVIGSHRDCVQCESQTIATVNKELKSIFLPMFREELIVYRSHEEILFPVNSLEPNKDDEVMFDRIRSSIRDASLGEKIDIPFSYFMFEQDITRYAKQQGRDILTFDECIEIGILLKMGPEVVQAALIYFHQNNTFLYFHFFPELVFTNPQAPLDFVNTIVAFSYKVLAGCYCGLPADYSISLEKAIITEEMLQHESFSSCFIPDIYQSQHAIKLFTHLFVIAPLTDGKKYLMPCLLQDLSDIRSLLPQSSVAVFVVRFSDDCAPNGTFGGSVSCLLSAHGWEICYKEDGTAQCLAHNIVTLHAPNMPAKITYVNATRHFEIHVMCSDVKGYASMFPRIRKAIFSAIQATFTVMQFVNVAIEDAFLCDCHLSKSVPHAAKLCHFEQNYYLECTKVTDFNCEVNDTHTIWLHGQIGGERGKSIRYREYNQYPDPQ